MKKNLFVLSALAVATASAHAYTVLDNKETGTKVDFTGSARLVWLSESNKERDANGDVSKEHINHAVANNGSRFGFKINQQLGGDFYALGRVEWRFRGTSRSQHDFDDIYTRQLYAGIGSKTYGELTYGHQFTIADDVKQTDLANTLSLSDGLLNGFARKSIQYVYSGVEGLDVGVFYGDHSKRRSNGLDLKNKRKDIAGFGAVYDYKIDDQQSLRVGTGVTRERSFNSDHSIYKYTAYSLGSAYTFDKTTIGLDLERAVTKDQGTIGSKETQKEVRTIVKQEINKDWAAYTMYAYKTNHDIAGDKTKTHQFMVGTEYFVVPKYLKTFVETSSSRSQNYDNGVKSSKERDNLVAIGLRAYW